MLAIFLLVNCIYFVQTAPGKHELQENEDTRSLNPFGILQYITNFNVKISNFVSSITNSIKSVISNIRNTFQTLTGTKTTTSAPATTTTTASSNGSSSTTSSSVAAKERICMNNLGVELPCSQVSAPYCWTKFPCNSEFPPGSSTPKPMVTFTTNEPDTFTDDTVYVDGVAKEGFCMDVNENWLPCSQVKEPYCYYTHPC